MNNIIIVSDDLTGANDSGVQFAKHGIPTVVCIDDSELPNLEPDVKACVINAESRSLSPDEAYRKWTHVLQSVDLDSYQIVLKKIDSTLRGNLGMELKACMDTGLFKAAVVVPAYPQKGRKTIGGYQLVHQHLLEDSEISKDPKFPVTDSKVSEIIKRQWDCPVGEIEINTLRSGDWLDRIETIDKAGGHIFVFDSATEEDIRQIVTSLSGQQVLWVGAAGLAEALADQCPRQTLESVQPSERSPKLPVLVMAGSVSEVTAGQVEALRQEGFESVTIDPMVFLERARSDKQMDAWVDIQAVEQVNRFIGLGHDVVISTDASPAKRKQVYALQRELGLGGVGGGNLIADCMGKLAAAIIEKAPIAGAVLTGGDIAYHTCKHLGVRSLRIIEEVEEGLPLCLTEGSLNIPLVTKAGAFGNRLSMLAAARAIGTRGHAPTSDGGVANKTSAY